MANTHEQRTPDQCKVLWDSQQKRIDDILQGSESLKAYVRVPVQDGRYMVGFDRLDHFDKGECVIELQKSDQGYVFSIGETIIAGKHKKIGLPNYRERSNRFSTDVFDRFVISGDERGFTMLGVNSGEETPVLPSANYEPAEDLFATCIFALENHRRTQAKLATLAVS